MAIKSRNDKRVKRHARARKNLVGTPEKPRLCVFRSNKNISAQVVDDTTGRTLVSAGTVEKELAGLKNKVEDAQKFGEVLGKRCIEKGVQTVVFDRNGYLYHGVVKAIADGARKAGVKF